MQITNFLVYGPIADKYHYFIKGTYFSAKSAHRVIETDQWTGQPIMIPRDYRRLCVYPLKQLDRKVIIYPLQSPSNSYLVIAPDQPIICESIHIPYYTNSGDVIQVETTCRSCTYMLVVSVEDNSHTVKGYVLKKVRGPVKRWSLSSDTTSISFEHM